MQKIARLILLLALTAGVPAIAQTTKPEEPKKLDKKVKSKPDTKMAEDKKPAEPPVDAVNELALKGLKARSIGPALMGGRIADISMDAKDSTTYFIALGTGGIFKTTNNGVTFTDSFGKEAVASVGAVAVAPSNGKIVYAGTGEANDRNSSSYGNGVYRSEDGGGKWTNVGLKTSRTIARIVVHPTDPNTVWVAATGDLWQPGGERGIYKSTDGGKSWTGTLKAPAPYDQKVGGGDLAIDPSDPNVLYAAMYARQRTPWSFTMGPDFTDGKDHGGIYKSSDGGNTWRKLDKGLPKNTGRIGLATTPKNPKVVMAIVFSTDAGGNGPIMSVKNKTGGIFRSEDGGENWTRTSDLNPRPFYFSQIRIAPDNDNKVYVLGFSLHVSEDGGKTFREDMFKKVHPDLHALAIDPRNPKHLLLGTDGGLYRSYDGGSAWEFLNNIAAGQFYRVNYDMSTPYRVCGGLQDNLNWVGPSRTFTKDGITNSDWINIGGGDGFYCAFDRDEPHLVYTESQEGYMHRMDLRTGDVRELRPEPMEGQRGFRFHWNSPLIQSRHKKALFLAGNRVFRLTQRGEHYQAISPDLSAQDATKNTTVGSGAENYGVVYSLAESPIKAGLLWAATDDGKLWITEDEGGNWTDLTKNLPQPIQNEWISRVEASWHDAKVAYLAVPAYRSGKYSPYAYRTADGGKTWLSVAGNLPQDQPVKVLREDPKNPDLLYAGTEQALFISLNRGASWARFGGMPTVAVDDILVHERDRDLIIATHGRSLFIVDDVSALQELTADVRNKDLHLFQPRAVVARPVMDGWADWAGASDFRGENPPLGAVITFYSKSYTGEPVSIVIKNAADQPVAKLSAPGTPGISRVTWDLKPAKDYLVQYGGEGSKFLRAGEYTVTVTQGDHSESKKLKVEVAEGVETR